MSRRSRIAAVLGVLATLLVADAAPAAYDVTVRRTAHGIPHVTGRDFPAAAYGLAWAFAEDNLCVLADSYVTVRGERSRYFGPDGSWRFGGNGTTNPNLSSDFFFRKLIAQGTVRELVSEPPPAGPVPEIREAVRGYVAGYNDYLRHVGVDGIPDPACRGAEWVTPITEDDVYARFYQLALMASSGVAIDGIGGAAPLTGPAAASAIDAQRSALDGMSPQRFDELLGGIGSNAYGLGREATRSGHGIVLGNPHFPWDGSERLWQSHVTIPDKGVDVAGASLFGVPLINIGFTRGLAWSHTVSTARRFTPFELQLVPGSATTYLVDGEPREMTATEVTVQVKTENGIEDRTRTLYDTEYGPVLTGILGLPIFPWTPTTAYALGDANAANFRYLNHFWFTNQAQTVAELDAIERRYLGIPWVNTIAADKTGRAYYADIGAVPNVSNEKIAECSTALGRTTDAALRVQILDGSRSACGWDSDPDAIKPGIFGPGNLPSLFRDDWVANSNDSYWLTNPAQPLEGFSRVIGDERTTRTPRTRLGIRIVQQRLDGSDGGSGAGFTPEQVRDAVFNNRQYLGELWRDELVAMCEANPTLIGSSGPVDVSAACPVLAAWDLRDDLDSRGAILFRRFATRATAAPGGLPVNPGVPSPFREPFDPADPVNTPRGLNTESPLVRAALADAVRDLGNAGIPLDAPLGEWQYEQRGSERIPIHGGPGGVGVFNAINVPWVADAGYPDVPHGSSHVQAVEVNGRCPKAYTILTYSQSTSPESPYHSDQTRRYSRKEWLRFPFCERQIRRDRGLARLDFGRGFRGEGPAGGERRLLHRLRVRAARRAVAVRFRLARRARVAVVARRAGEVVAQRQRGLRAGRSRVVLRLAPGRYRLEIAAQAGRRRETVIRGSRSRTGRRP